MKRITIAALGTMVSFAAAAQVYVQPYVDHQGQYHQGHMRSAPDNNPYNNYSTQGNTNPYTGQQGTVNPNPYPVPNNQVQQGYVSPGSSYVQPGMQNGYNNRGASRY